MDPAWELTMQDWFYIVVIVVAVAGAVAAMSLPV